MCHDSFLHAELSDLSSTTLERDILPSYYYMQHFTFCSFSPPTFLFFYCVARNVLERCFRFRTKNCSLSSHSISFKQQQQQQQQQEKEREREREQAEEVSLMVLMRC